MNRPSDLELPFFAYGLFRPGQLGFHRLREFVAREEPATAAGALLVRDGLPLLKAGGGGKVRGSLLTFNAPDAAYDRIIAMEPDHQYSWQQLSIATRPANVLVGRSPDKGSERIEGEWDGATDPLFTTAIRVVKETLANSSEFAWDLAPTFRLEMAYLLLWSSIERYASLKYHLGTNVWSKVKHLAAEPALAASLKRLSPEPRSVYRADTPTRKVTLTTEPSDAVEYYYQIRSNMSHRGKAVTRDHDRVLQSLRELTAHFESILDSTFPNRQRPAS